MTSAAGANIFQPVSSTPPVVHAVRSLLPDISVSIPEEMVETEQSWGQDFEQMNELVLQELSCR